MEFVYLFTSWLPKVKYQIIRMGSTKARKSVVTPYQLSLKFSISYSMSQTCHIIANNYFKINGHFVHGDVVFVVHAYLSEFYAVILAFVFAVRLL